MVVGAIVAATNSVNYAVRHVGMIACAEPQVTPRITRAGSNFVVVSSPRAMIHQSNSDAHAHNESCVPCDQFLGGMKPIKAHPTPEESGHIFWDAL